MFTVVGLLLVTAGVWISMMLILPWVFTFFSWYTDKVRKWTGGRSL